MESESAEGRLFDLFMMGLAWLRQDNPGVLSRLGASVFASLQYSGAGFHLAQHLAAQSWDLAEFVRDRSVVHAGDREPRRQELRRLITESEKHNVILAVPAAGMAPMLLFGPCGYQHVITETGMAYAASITDSYADIITQEQFLQGWETRRTRMASYNARRDTEKKTEQSG
jgi:hypothetical protein